MSEPSFSSERNAVSRSSAFDDESARARCVTVVSIRVTLRVCDQLRCRFAQRNLIAHFLDSCGKSFNWLLLLGDRREKFRALLRNCRCLCRGRSLQFLNLAMLFQKLIEQHRIHCFVANGIDLAIVVANNQVGVHLLNLLGYEAELRDAIRIKLLNQSPWRDQMEGGGPATRASK